MGYCTNGETEAPEGLGLQKTRASVCSPAHFCRIFEPLNGEPQGPLGVEAFQGLLWRRGRGGLLDQFGGLARARDICRPRPRPRRHAARLACSLVAPGFDPEPGPRLFPGCGMGFGPGPHLCQQLGRASVPGLPGGRALSPQIRLRQPGTGGWDPDGREGAGARQPKTPGPTDGRGGPPGTFNIKNPQSIPASTNFRF